MFVQNVESSIESVEQLPFDFHPHLPVVVLCGRGQLASVAGLLPLQ